MTIISDMNMTAIKEILERIKRFEKEAEKELPITLMTWTKDLLKLTRCHGLWAFSNPRLIIVISVVHKMIALSNLHNLNLNHNFCLLVT